MPPNVACNFSSAGRVADMNRILQVQLFRKSRQIVGVGVHLVAIPGLVGTALPSPVMRDHSIAALPKEQHLSVPVVRRERPAVAEHYGLACSPVLVIDRGAVFRFDCRHGMLSLWF